jgi:glycosyltransferase involved in cell wall biosynthesis
VVTVHNRVQFLRNALESVIGQTARSFEIIVSDDSNNPEIKSICDSFHRPDIRYRSNPAPLGVALNLRAAIAEARGQYIAILNDDDSWEPEFLALLLPPLEDSSERVLAFGDHWIMSEDGQIDVGQTDENTGRYRRDTLPEGEIRDWETQAVLDHTVPLAMAAIFRKDAVNWDLVVKDVAGAYDFWITCLLASTGRPAYYIAKRISRYRIHSSMETARKAAGKNENMVFIFARLIELGMFSQLKVALRHRYRDALFVCGKGYLLFDQPSRAREYFLKSCKASVNTKALAGLLLTYLPRQLRSKCLAAFARKHPHRSHFLARLQR